MYPSSRCVAVAVLLMLAAPAHGTQDFSVDPESPEVPNPFDPADVITYTGGLAAISASTLGVPTGDNVDALSDGLDALPWDSCGSPVPPGGPGMKSFFFSVSRGSEGLAGQVVHTQAQGNGAAGDRFRLDRFWDNCPGPAAWQNPVLATDAPGIGLTPLPPSPQSNIDALDEGTPSDFGRDHNSHGLFFSVAPGGSWGPADILYQDTLVPGATPPPVVYATASQLGLLPGDDIDALAIRDPDEDGSLDPGDIVYVSLAAGSPSLGAGLTEADVIEVHPAAVPAEVVDRSRFGLAAGDDLDALTVKDPAPSITCDPLDPPQLDGRLWDWCHCSTPRVEDRSAVLDCGFEELVWWDRRQDGAVNDLATLATRQDESNLYFAVAWSVALEFESIPLVEIAIDFRPGGNTTWRDPLGVLTAPGRCSVFTDRACTSDADCHFCGISREPFPSMRVRTCGSECDFGTNDVCEQSQTCIDLGAGGPASDVGRFSNPSSKPDYLVVLDLTLWLFGLNGVQLLEYADGTWIPVGEFSPFVPSSLIFTPERPPATLEIEIPWSAFGCTGCPEACNCSGFGPGQDFRITAAVARTAMNLDYAPDGPFEDVMSEPLAGTATTTTNDCPGLGIAATLCEIGDGSADAFVPAPLPGHSGRTSGLRLGKDGPLVTLTWNPSCSAAAVDYEVYGGDLGAWYSHSALPGLCTTGGTAAAVFESAAGDRYYLVVPSDGSTEGSYGENATGGERPVGTSQCFAQSTGTCP